MPDTTSDCTHHWILGIPDENDVVVGRCKRCGARRAYPSCIEDARRDQAAAAASGNPAIEQGSLLPAA